MVTTMDGNRLANISVSGSGMEANLRDVCVGASLSLGASKVSEMKLTFQDDHALSIFRAGLFAAGASINYGEWYLSAESIDVGSNDTGPTLTVTAPSRFVTNLRKQTGEKNWGETPVSSWVESVAKSVGMSTLVQPGLGNREIIRQAPEDGGESENTWDVLTGLAREVGVWLFEYGSTLVFAKPSYLLAVPWARRVWPLVWNSFGDKSEALVGLPKYTDDPGSDPREKMTLSIVAPDADLARPGDEVDLGGTNIGKIGGRWIIESVDFPLKSLGAVTLSCLRPIDPKVEPPREAKPKAEPKATTARPSPTSKPSAGGAPTPNQRGVAGAQAAVSRWAASVNGRAIDMDGAYGAQCVDLARHYSQNVVGTGPVMGNGRDWYGNAPGSHYTRIPAGGQPAVGDIACWGPAQGGGYGHVAIVLSEDWGQDILCMSQNPGPARKMSITKHGLQGYLRPKQVR